MLVRSLSRLFSLFLFLSSDNVSLGFFVASAMMSIQRILRWLLLIATHESHGFSCCCVAWWHKALRSSLVPCTPKLHSVIPGAPGRLVKWHRRHSPYYKSLYHQNDFEDVILR